MSESGPAGRERILAAAEELFAEHGYARTSTAKLAAAARVPQGLIFYHFGTKLELLLTLIRESSETVLAELLPAAEPDGPTDLRTTVAQLWEVLRVRLGTPTPLHRIVLRERDTHPEVAGRAAEIQHAIVDAVAERLSRAAGRPGAPSARDRAAARMLVDVTSLTLVHGGDGSAGDGSDDVLTADVVAGLLVEGLRER